MVDLKHLYQKKIFVDSNAFIYFFTGQCNNLAKEIFSFAEKKWLTLITTVRVLDEVCFKVMIISAKAKFGIETKVLKRLKRDRSKIKLVAEDVQRVIEFVNKARIEVKGISYTELKKMPYIMDAHGLFGNDALILATIQRFNLKYLLSSDKDFDRISFVERIDPRLT
ncbi:PilT protein domain protein [Thermodesulfatator indicus DSM 15286]|uniref:PilT protein domain protein n=1 Tax=Thermodesulfatator indicus (strain DSM 15286 / JCM 11887 / CIR29812) TaxID=667014 RepID=F8ACP3_THEID|nr:PIN domain-containing protein [Thermodesulfatator indicus]AEH45822.1 PilT protein domain protein [Thermodesulfatator indicus DSM 15286]